MPLRALGLGPPLGEEPASVHPAADKENDPLMMPDAGLRTDSGVGFPSYPARGSTRIF